MPNEYMEGGTLLISAVNWETTLYVYILGHENDFIRDLGNRESVSLGCCC